MGNQAQQSVSIRDRSILDHQEIFISQICDQAQMWEKIRNAAAKDPALAQTARFRDWQSNTRQGQQVRDAAGFALSEQLMKNSASITKYIEQKLKCVTQIPEVIDPPSLGHEQYRWAFENAAGEASWSSELQGDFPRAIVSVDGWNYTTLMNAKASWVLNDLDVARAALIPGFMFANSLQRRCGRMIAEGLDKAAFIGTTDGGVTLPGLLNQTSVVDNVANPGAALSTLSADALYAFYKTQFSAYITKFGDAENYPWHALVSKAEHMRVNMAPLGTGLQLNVSDRLKLDFGNYGFQGFDFNAFMATAGTGASSMLCIYPRDPEVLGRVNATTYTEGEPIRTGFATEIKAYGRTGGVALRQPASVRYVYNL